MKGVAATRAVLIGAASGLRSQIGLASVALSGRAAGAPGALALLAGRPAEICTAAAAVGELIVDKLPATPSRLTAAGLAPRVVLGGLAAAVLAADAAKPITPAFGDDGFGNAFDGDFDDGFHDGGEGGDSDSAGSASAPPPPPVSPILLAAAIGGGTAALAALGGAWWRHYWSLCGRADWPAALLEDAVAMGLALSACSRPTPPPRTGDAAW